MQQDGRFHFYLKRSLPPALKGDVQKLDIGIALAHFVLALEEQGLAGRVAEADPGIAHDEDTEYILTWQI